MDFVQVSFVGFRAMEERINENVVRLFRTLHVIRYSNLPLARYPFVMCPRPGTLNTLKTL